MVSDGLYSIEVILHKSHSNPDKPIYQIVVFHLDMFLPTLHTMELRATKLHEKDLFTSMK